jgi:hypothetical protein
MVLASAAMAQGGGGRGQGMRMMGGGDSSGLMLLQRADVQKEIVVTDDQKSKLDAVRQKMMEDMRAQFQGGGGQPPDREAMQKTMQTMMDNMKKEAEKILTKDQMTRLHELAIQIAGNNAATWADVQKEIGVTDDQKAKIKDLQSKQQEANQALFQKMRDQEITREELQDAMKKNTDSFNTELGKILTDAQKAKLKTMGGKEFKQDKSG